MPPSSVEGADAARGVPCNGMAVSITADVVLRIYLGQKLFIQESIILIGNYVVLDAAHGFLAHHAGRDQDMYDDRKLFLISQVIKYVLGPRDTVTLNQLITIIPNHEGRGRVWIVLGRGVHPIVALHTLVDPARVNHFLREFAFGNPRLQIGVRAVSMDVAQPAETLPVDYVIESVRGAGRKLAGIGPDAVLS